MKIDYQNYHLLWFTDYADQSAGMPGIKEKFKELAGYDFNTDKAIAYEDKEDTLIYEFPRFVVVYSCGVEWEIWSKEICFIQKGDERIWMTEETYNWIFRLIDVFRSLEDGCLKNIKLEIIADYMNLHQVAETLNVTLPRKMF